MTLPHRLPSIIACGALALRDNEKDRIVEVRAKRTDDGKLKLYCALDSRDYRPHTASAAALPRGTNAVRR